MTVLDNVRVAQQLPTSFNLAEVIGNIGSFRRKEQALAALEADQPLTELLGSEFMQLYLAVKRHEIGKAASHGADASSAGFLDRVEPFEVDEYFEFL